MWFGDSGSEFRVNGLGFRTSSSGPVVWGQGLQARSC